MDVDPSVPDQELARGVEAAWAWCSGEAALAYRRMRAETEATYVPIEGGGVNYYGPGSSLSQGQGFGLDGPVSDELLDRIEAFYDERQTPTRLEVASLADPSFLPKLSARSYQIVEQTHMLARPLVGKESALAAIPSPQAVTVQQINASDRVKLNALNQVLLQGFFDGEADPSTDIGAILEAMMSIPNASGWLATLDDLSAHAHADTLEAESSPKPIGGGVLLIHEATALFAGDATHPAYRRRGAQQAAIQKRLAAAVEAGCRSAIVCTNPGSASQRNYERFGFRLIYARTLMARPAKSASIAQNSQSDSST